MVLSIDPGVATGVAVLTESGEIIFAYEVSGDARTQVRILAEVATDEVVIEEAPQQQFSPFLNDLHSALREAFPEATWLRPSDWKPTPRGQARVDTKSAHVKDAVRMGREYLYRKEHV